MRGPLDPSPDLDVDGALEFLLTSMRRDPVGLRDFGYDLWIEVAMRNT